MGRRAAKIAGRKGKADALRAKLYGRIGKKVVQVRSVTWLVSCLHECMHTSKELRCNLRLLLLKSSYCRHHGEPLAIHSVLLMECSSIDFQLFC